METLTSIGIINTSKKQHMNFYNTYMQHTIQQESELVYELWKQDELSLACILHKGINHKINEIMQTNRLRIS